MRFTPRISYELVCASSGKGLRVKGGRIGHLPLWGPLSLPIKQALLGPVRKTDEWSVVPDVRQVVLGEHELSIVVEK